MSRAEKIKAVVLILCVGALWPSILGYRAPWYSALMVAVTVLLLVMLYFRVRQMKQAFGEAARRAEEPGEALPFLPGSPVGDGDGDIPAPSDPAENN